MQTLLLADPDVIVRTLLAQYLRECGYRVLEASNSREVPQFLADTSRCAVSCDDERIDQRGQLESRSVV